MAEMNTSDSTQPSYWKDMFEMDDSDTDDVDKKAEKDKDEKRINVQVGHRYVLRNGSTGICMWIGCVHWMNKIDPYKQPKTEMMGIALDAKQGYSDGKWKGVRYFTCKMSYGSFMFKDECVKDCGIADTSSIMNMDENELYRNRLKLLLDAAHHADNV
eukprot:395870_1